MPRSRKPTDLESRISEVIAFATRQIAQLVRADFAEQVGRLAEGPPARGQRLKAPAAEKPRRRGRRGGINEATLSRVLKVIVSSPGLRSEQIYKKLPLPVAKVKTALAKLRAAKRVKTKGEKRSMTYQAA
jgi:hypothetical protein